MSIKVNVKAPNKSIREYLRVFLKAMEETSAKQKVTLVLELIFEDC